jgi:hypothetical protein
VARQPHHYEALREVQREALENVAEVPPPSEPVVTAAVEAEQPTSTEQEEPTRPEGHYGQSFVWTGEGGMAQQQASALDYMKAHAVERETAREESDFAPPAASPEASLSQSEAVTSFNDAAVEMTDARVARAQQLASLAQAEEQNQQPALQADYSQEQ